MHTSHDTSTIGRFAPRSRTTETPTFAYAHCASLVGRQPPISYIYRGGVTTLRTREWSLISSPSRHGVHRMHGLDGATGYRIERCRLCACTAQPLLRPKQLPGPPLACWTLTPFFQAVFAPLTREAPGGDGGLLQRPPPALLTTDTFIPAQNTTTCTMRPLGKAAAASGKAADGTRPGVHCGVWEGRRRRSSRAPHAT